MELKLVYRALRKISDWAMAGFYSEVYIEGRKNVTKESPMIIASSHHNEIIDIATLTATIPHRRHVSFWAKSTMFINPISRNILLSSGSIPVKRNPNSGVIGQTSSSNTPSDKANSTGSLSSHQSTLFRETSAALAYGQVIGVFPEGTSYSEPSVVQMMPGAAWAAVEYARWEREQVNAIKGGKDQANRRSLVIVPVGIVYTDKSQYRSRVFVQYGSPIAIDSYADELFGNSEEDPDLISRTVVRKIMGEVENQMFAMTINAPDWDTLYAARTARDILWEDEKNIPLRDFVHISQTLVKLFSPSNAPSSPRSLPLVKRSLIKYFALLHYTGITHPILTSLFPYPKVPSTSIPSPASESSRFVPHFAHAFLTFLSQLSATLLHPHFLLFLPPFLVHIPSYLMGTLAARFLATRGEEEGQAQFKTVVGGFGIGIGNFALVWGLIRWIVRLGKNNGGEGLLVSWNVSENTVSVLKQLRFLLSGSEGGFVGQVKRMLAIMSFTYGTVYVLVKWHNSLVNGNYRRLKRLIASFKILIGVLQPRSSDIQAAELEPYTKPPPPPVNPFIKRRRETVPATADIMPASEPNNPSGSSAVESKGSQPDTLAPRPISSRKLIRPLLVARMEATAVLGQYLQNPDIVSEFGEFLKKNRAMLPAVDLHVK